MIYLWKCVVCGQHEEVERPMADSSLPPDTGCAPWEEPHTADWQRVYEAPMQLKASYPDGHKRKGWAEQREAVKLEKQAAVTGSRQTRAEISKEIRTIRRPKR